MTHHEALTRRADDDIPIVRCAGELVPEGDEPFDADIFTCARCGSRLHFDVMGRVIKVRPADADAKVKTPEGPHGDQG